MDFNLEEMLLLRAQGWSTIALGNRYQKDHTTIVYHCKKHGVSVPPRITESGTLPIKEVSAPARLPSRDKYAYAYEEPINNGKSYKEYLREQKMRESKKLTVVSVSLVTSFVEEPKTEYQQD
jgi:hypothetical protein